MKALIVCIQNSNPAISEKAAQALNDRGVPICVMSRSYDHLDDDPCAFEEALAFAKEADFVLLRCMAEATRFKKVERLLDEVRVSGVRHMVFSLSPDMRPMYRDSFSGADCDYEKMCEFLTFGGLENEVSLLSLMINLMGQGRLEVPEPIRPPQYGLFHPFKDVGDTERYLCDLDPGKPTAGLIISATDVMMGNTSHISALIAGLEEQGMDVIPCFYHHLAESKDPAASMAECIKRFMVNGSSSRIDVLLSCVSNSILIQKGTDGNPFEELTGVPVLQVLCVHGPWGDVEQDREGLRGRDLTMMVVRPELDGQIITVPIGCVPPGESSQLLEPIEDRIDHIVRLTRKYADLRRKPASERKIAILMYQPREDSGCIGSASGFDVPESVCRIISRLNEEGYTIDHVPENSRELIDEVLANVTNDMSYAPPNMIRSLAQDLIGLDRYRAVFESISEYNRVRLREKWGDPVGRTSVVDNKIVIPGLMNGNILISYQPMRCWSEQYDSLYHDPIVPAPHSYLAFYRWLKDVFKADAVVHMGTHGSLEWLPGKSVGLSRKCDPDMILDGIPNLYPFCIDDPGEGIQAKRRTEAVLIGHLNPTMARAGTYDELSEIDVKLQEYFLLKASCSQEKKRLMLLGLRDSARDASLFEDLKIPDNVSEMDFEHYVDGIHDYITELKDALIRDGLHILGNVPEGNLLDEAIYSISRLPDGDIASLRNSFGIAMGFDLDKCISDPHGITEGKLNSAILDEVDSALMDVLQECRHGNFKDCLNRFEARVPTMTADLSASVLHMQDVIVPRLLRTSDEMKNFTIFLSGGYVPPGPSGPPTRGNSKVLPTGRNFYGLDPDQIPSRASWEVGKRMADQMLERVLNETGSIPREIGMVIWATDTMKTNGDDVAYILWLMGVMPIWSATGHVTGLEVVPLDDLKRPRIDVTIRITGLFRDAFPNLVDMFNDAVDLISDLDESDEDNALLANIRMDMVEAVSRGLPDDECRKAALARVFGSPPGSYGAGVDIAIGTGDWKNTKDLADIYETWSSYVYGHGMYGECRRDDFKRRFSKVSVTVKNMPDRENDILGMDEVYNYLGGMNAYTKAYGKEDAIFFIGDDSDPNRTKLRTVAEECRFIFRSKVINPKWIDGLKRHGYRGASELAHMTEYLIGWDGTSDSIDDWMYDAVVDKILMDDGTREWLLSENPHAMMTMLDRLSEAIDRELWNASDDMMEKIRNLYMESEARVEELMDCGRNDPAIRDGR